MSGTFVLFPVPPENLDHTGGWNQSGHHVSPRASGPPALVAGVRGEACKPGILAIRVAGTVVGTLAGNLQKCPGLLSGLAA